ncbi:hypothetical protein B566_EDAN004549 [Ephemera danica]|nr:hypothetical protein B566_EDAN004549 [Ephemera danica]
MAEDPQGNLQNYKLQLQQVEAALTTDPENQELIKLKVDLEEVIELTKDLVRAYHEELEQKKAESGGIYYDATVGEVNSEAGEVTVLFDSYQHSEVIKMELLRDLEQRETIKRKAAEGLMAGSKIKKQMVQRQRDYLKKKKQKKQQRFKEIEEERETEKNKWLNFAGKKKGVVKKSIFASPDNVNGRVGIGTCGIGGRPMTEYSAADKWKKGV